MNIEARSVGKGKFVLLLKGNDGQVKHSDEMRPALERDRDRFIKRVADVFPSVDTERIREKLLELADLPPAPGSGPDRDMQQVPQDAPQDLEAALEALGSGDLLDQIRADLQARGLACDLDVALIVYLGLTSRLLPSPVCVFTQGPSSTGKSFITSVVAGLMPPEAVFDVHGITPNALHYMDDRLVHSALLTGEWCREDDQSENGVKTQALRQLISEGRISKLFTNTETGRPEAEQATTEGPVAVCATSTLPMSRIFEEDENRFLFVHTDESEAATRLVLDRKAAIAAGASDAGDVLERIARRHHAMQRWIGRHADDVVVPFATRLAKQFPADQPRRRRDLDKVLSLVRSSALLHLRQRERDDRGRILASIEDYRLVHRLLSPFMVTRSATPAPMNKYHELAAALGPLEAFNRQGAQEIWRLGKARASELLNELRDAGLLADAPGRGWTYQLREFAGERQTILPEPVGVQSSGIE
jgi:hypothetical protein